jgi:type IV pilus assembly protein PilY1
MGRGIYIVDAANGDIIWAAGGQARPASLPSAATYVQVSGMDCSIPSDVSVLKNQSGTTINRGYVGDTCGNVWRLDFGDTSVSNWRATKLASVASTAAASGRRKFLFAPDVVFNGSFDAVLMGSGDREHPFDTTVINRMYMFKDTGTLTSPVSGNVSTAPPLSPAGTTPTIVESAMFDASSDCIQVASACGAGVTPADALASLTASSGWFVTLANGEKVIGGAVTLAGTTFFNTNLPSASAGGGACGSNLGIAREYQVSFANASSVNDLNPGGGLTLSDRFAVHAGGGYLPTPVPVVVQIGGQTVQAVISGVSVQQAPGATLQSRLRKYWYKEIE